MERIDKLLTKLGSRIKVVPWDDVRSPYKSIKYGFWIGATAEVRMLRNIAQTITLSETLKSTQCFGLHPVRMTLA